MRRGRIPYVRNFLLILVLECLWAFGTWLAHPMTVMPQYVLRLGGTPRWVGLLSSLWALGTGGGAVFIGVVAAHRVRLSRWTGWLHLAAIVPWTFLIAITLLAEAGRIAPHTALLLALASLFVFNVMLGTLVQIYFVILARTLPERGRGLWFGGIFAVSSAVGAIAPWVAGRWFIGETADLGDYARIFAVSAACFVAGTVPFFFLHERPGAPEPRRTLRANLRRLIDHWRERAALRRYLGFRFVLELGALVGGFAATYSRQEAGFSEHRVTQLGVLVVASEAVASLGFGWLSRILESGRRGARGGFLRAQAVAQGVSYAALGFAAAARPGGPARLAAIFLVLAIGVRVCADFVLHTNILMHLGGRGARLDAMALGAVTLMPASLLVQAGGGRAIEAFGHRPVFLAAFLLALPALAGLWRMGGEFARTPRRAPVLH
jgi:hypothetical protein